MKILKFLFFLIIFFFIIAIIAAYNLNQNYNLKKIINKLEKEYNAEFILKEKPKWFFFPKIQLNIKSRLKNNLEKYSSEDINFSFIQHYKLSPLMFEINSNSFFIKDLEIKLLDALGSYSLSDKKITMQNIQGKIGDGHFISNGIVDFSDKEKIILEGNFKNLHLNQIFRQLYLANWQRIELRLSSNSFLLSSTRKKFLQNIEGTIPLTGSMYFVVTEEERFGITFLRLLIEQMPNFNNLSKSLSQIIEGFGGTPALFEGELKIKNGMINTDNLKVNNNNNRIDIKGSYDIISDLFDVKIYFFDSNNLVVEAIVLGNIENPSIQIINENIISKNEENTNDLKKVFEEGIQSLIDRFLGAND